MALSPNAPAAAQRAASSLIFVSKSAMRGRPWLKTQSLRCFQSIQGTSRTAEARPLRMGLGASCLADCHQSLRDGSWSGMGHGTRSQLNTSCQACRARGHSNFSPFGAATGQVKLLYQEPSFGLSQTLLHLTMSIESKLLLFLKWMHLLF